MNADGDGVAMGDGRLPQGTDVAGTPPCLCQKPPHCTTCKPYGYQTKGRKDSRTPTAPRSAPRGGRSHMGASCPVTQRERGAWVARGQAEPEEKAIPPPGQGRRERARWPARLRGRKWSKRRHGNTGSGADSAAASATADRAANGDAPARSPGAQAADRSGRPNGPGVGAALPTEHQPTHTALRTRICQMGAKVPIVTAGTRQRVTGQALPSTSSRGTCTASHVSRDKRGSSSLTAGGGETRQHRPN